MVSKFDFITNMSSHELTTEIAKYLYDCDFADFSCEIYEAIRDSFENEKSEYGCVNYSDIACRFASDNYNDIVENYPILGLAEYVGDVIDSLLGNGDIDDGSRLLAFVNSEIEKEYGGETY